MKKLNYAIALATFCFASFSTHAQEDGQQMLTQEGGSGSGSGQQYALRVLAPLDGTSSIGGRMMLDDNMGIDLDLNFNFRSKTTKVNGVNVDIVDADTEQGVRDVVGNTKGLTLGVSAGLINYMSKGRVSPYYKVGGRITLYTGNQGDALDNEVSVFGGLGAEFFIIPEFSLFAEADLDFAVAPDVAITTGTSQVGLAYYF